MKENCDYLFCCNNDEGHVGRHLLNAAKSLKLKASYVDHREAYQAPKWLNRINWWLLGRRPPRLNTHSQKILSQCQLLKPKAMVSTGTAPITKEILEKIGEAGILRANFLTDDPWNSAHHSKWFLKALPQYDIIFTPRKALIKDLKELGCKNIEYLPFAYAPEIHFPQKLDKKDVNKYECDISFIGGADKDRIPYIRTLIKAGLKVKVYGGYWGRYRATRSVWGGIVLGAELRKAVSRSKINLCLVRKANRDGHVMRTYELAAMKACILAEDTDEHRQIYGRSQDGCVEYFDGIPDMIFKVKNLLNDFKRRETLKKNVYHRIKLGKNSYQDRLIQIVKVIKKIRKYTFRKGG